MDSMTSEAISDEIIDIFSEIESIQPGLHCHKVRHGRKSTVEMDTQSAHAIFAFGRFEVRRELFLSREDLISLCLTTAISGADKDKL